MTKEELQFSLEIAMTKENIEDLHSKFFLVEDLERWPVCKTMWCCKNCSDRKGFSSPCKCSEIQVVDEEGKATWMPTRISCDGCGTSWKPSTLSIWKKG